MRINKFVALSSGLSRRAADVAIANGRVTVNGQPIAVGQAIAANDAVTLDGQPLRAPVTTQVIILHKPVGYVSSRTGQGSRTIYDLIPPELQHLKPVGRLDKDSSGLLLLTDDGELANQLTHPRYGKIKMYEVELDKSLSPADAARIEQGITIDDYISQLQIKNIADNRWQITMAQGKNRQIRKTFAALGYTVTKLHRTQFGDYRLGSLASGAHQIIA